MRKILMAVLCFMFVPIAVLFAGCEFGKDNSAKTDTDAQIRAIYNLAVESGSAGGLTYEQWLEQIKGDAGENIQLQVSEGYIQWKLQSSTEWTNLIELNNLKGDKGDEGDAGNAGKDGSKWLSGDDAPASDVGTNGDYYLDTENCAVYKKSNNVWTKVINSLKGDEGDVGNAGKDGSKWLSGDDTPASDVGTNGDYYLDTAKYAVYKKSNNVWTKVIDSLKGDAGENATAKKYTVTFNYEGKEDRFVTTTTSVEVESTEWLTNLPTVKEEYEDYFQGWFIDGTDFEFSKYSFVGGNVTLYCKWDNAEESPDATLGNKVTITLKQKEDTFTTSTCDLTGKLPGDEIYGAVTIKADANTSNMVLRASFAFDYVYNTQMQSKLDEAFGAANTGKNPGDEGYTTEKAFYNAAGETATEAEKIAKFKTLIAYGTTTYGAALSDAIGTVATGWVKDATADTTDEYYYYTEEVEDLNGEEGDKETILKTVSAGTTVDFVSAVTIPTAWTNDFAQLKFSVSVNAEALQQANKAAEGSSWDYPSVQTPAAE